MTTKTLSDHCALWYASRGTKYPTSDPELNKLMYEAWVEYAFKDFKEVG